MTYRKNIGGRQFWSIEGTKLTTVINMESRSMIDRQENAVYVEGIIHDTQTYLPATEEEFKKAFSEAFAVVSMGKIV